MDFAIYVLVVMSPCGGPNLAGFFSRVGKYLESSSALLYLVFFNLPDIGRGSGIFEKVLNVITASPDGGSQGPLVRLECSVCYPFFSLHHCGFYKLSFDPSNAVAFVELQNKNRSPVFTGIYTIPDLMGGVSLSFFGPRTRLKLGFTKKGGLSKQFYFLYLEDTKNSWYFLMFFFMLTLSALQVYYAGDPFW